MVKQKLQVFARIKPSSYQNQTLQVLIQNNDTIIIQTSRTKLSQIRQQHQYGFTHVFQEQASQQQIFQHLAKPVIDNCLQGYNGTIFAYGQTGSGKTYTMSGGDSWEQRGIIPRVLSYVFGQIQKVKHEIKYQITVSYIQVYNQNAYDLLNQHNEESNFQQWPKITFMEDQENRFVIKNGSINTCKTQGQALDYLMMGNYLRKVSCTNLNQASSRSHCIFILNVKGINLATSTQIFSKINLVDLAGSQRVSKSHAQGLVLTEAKSINLSLSYLQQVIVSLNQKSKGKNKIHVPYRNSLLTTLLKDSLGGNCKTVMIATISSEIDNQEQTISTLRFSQRVRQIKNEVIKNQMNSLQTKLQMLERQNMMLRKKLEKANLVQDLQKNSEFKRSDSDEIKQLKENQLNINQVSRKIEDYMCEKISEIKVQRMDHVNIYFSKMREIYTERMKEYVSQLGYISQKIDNYERMLTQRERKNLFIIKPSR